MSFGENFEGLCFGKKCDHNSIQPNLSFAPFQPLKERNSSNFPITIGLNYWRIIIIVIGPSSPHSPGGQKEQSLYPYNGLLTAQPLTSTKIHIIWSGMGSNFENTHNLLAGLG